MKMSSSLGLAVLLPVLAMAGTIRPAAECTGQYTKLVGGTCYELYTSQVDWEAAFSQCRADGGNLVAITDANKQSDVEALLIDTQVTSNVWTGAVLEDPEKQSGKPTTMWRLVPDCWACDIPTICNPGGTGTSAAASPAGSTTRADEDGNVYKGGLDICFVMDNSGSISDEDWSDTVLEFMITFIDKLDVGTGPEQAHVAAVKFGNNAELEFTLAEFPDKAALKARVRQIEHQPENTNTSAGIEMARSLVFTETAGDRRGAPNVMILFTDGMSTFNASDTTSQAQKSKDESIISFVIGVTNNVNENEIRNVSDSPQKEGVTYWKVPRFSDVTDDVIGQMFDEVCAWQERNWMMTRTAVEAQGCHDEPPVTTYRESLDLPVLLDSSNTMTVDVCIYDCRNAGYDFAGVRVNSCYCGNEFGKNGISAQCDTPCPGDPAQNCGGEHAMNVFYVSGTKQARWAPGEPRQDNLFAWCGTLRHVDNYYGTAECTERYRYHCKLPSGSCSGSDGTYTRIPNAYCIFTGNEKDTWHNARAKCVSKGGDLLTTDTDTDRVAATNALKNSVTWSQSDTKSWIGVYKRNYYWANGDDQAGRDVTFVKFDPDASVPQPAPGDGDCLHLVWDTQKGEAFWYTGSCKSRHNFICEWPTDGSTTTSTTTTSTSTTTTTTSSPGTTASSSTSKGSTGRGSTPSANPTNEGPTPTRAGPNAGASTNNGGGGLSTTYIILIVILVLLFLLIVCLVIWFCCCRAKRHSTIHPYSKKYDARPVAPVPQTGGLGYGDDGYDLDGYDYDNRSTRGIITK